MKNRRKGWQWDRRQIPLTALLLMVGMFGKGPVVNANPANFASLSLSPGFSSKTVKGYAKGAIALHRVVGERDMQRNMCLGYGSPSPDHVLVLKKKVNKLRLQVNSRRDTTLLIKGPNNRLYCLDDSSKGKDAGWIANQLPAGKYSIWVGAFERGQQFRYTVTVDEP